MKKGKKKLKAKDDPERVTATMKLMYDNRITTIKKRIERLREDQRNWEETIPLMPDKIKNLEKEKEEEIKSVKLKLEELRKLTKESRELKNNLIRTLKDEKVSFEKRIETIKLEEVEVVESRQKELERLNKEVAEVVLFKKNRSFLRTNILLRKRQMCLAQEQHTNRLEKIYDKYLANKKSLKKEAEDTIYFLLSIKKGLLSKQELKATLEMLLNKQKKSEEETASMRKQRQDKMSFLVVCDEDFKSPTVPDFGDVDLLVAETDKITQLLINMIYIKQRKNSVPKLTLDVMSLEQSIKTISSKIDASLNKITEFRAKENELNKILGQLLIRCANNKNNSKVRFTREVSTAASIRQLGLDGRKNKGVNVNIVSCETMPVNNLIIGDKEQGLTIRAVLLAASRIVNEALSMKVVEMGLLPEERNLADKEMEDLYKRRRDFIYNRRGLVLQYLESVLSHAFPPDGKESTDLSSFHEIVATSSAEELTEKTSDGKVSLQSGGEPSLVSGWVSDSSNSLYALNFQDREETDDEERQGEI